MSHDSKRRYILNFFFGVEGRMRRTLSRKRLRKQIRQYRRAKNQFQNLATIQTIDDPLFTP